MLMSICVYFSYHRVVNVVTVQRAADTHHTCREGPDGTLKNVMGWKQNKMVGGKGGESTSTCSDPTPSTYSPLSRKTGTSSVPSLYSAKGHYLQPYSAPDATATYSYAPYSKSDPRTQYDALPVGTLGTYDPAADEIDYGFYQNARPNRRRLLYSTRPPDPEPEEAEKAIGDQYTATNGGGGGAGGLAGAVGGGGGRRSRRRRDSGLRLRAMNAGDLGGADNPEDSLDEMELSTETIYVMLLVLASTAITMLAAYLMLS